MSEVEARFEAIEHDINNLYLVIFSTIVLAMQAGFAFLEAGSVRAKNTTTILIANFLYIATGTISYWATGYAFGFGSNNNPVIGTNQFFLSQSDKAQHSFFFFQLSFALTAGTITSGAIAERTSIMSFIIHSSFFTAFIYPVVTHWVWSPNGWLADLDYIDYAGSSVVHITGGTSALIGAIISGPRRGRYEKGTVQPIPGHSTVLTALGFFILWFGFFAFNGVSNVSLSGADFDSDLVSLTFINSALSFSGGALAALLITKVGYKKSEIKVFEKEFKMINVFGGSWSLLAAINGGLASMVAICAGADSMEPWAGFTTGCVAGLVYCCWARATLFLHIDDPVNAIAVHLGGGTWGVIAAILFLKDDRKAAFPDGGILYAWNRHAFLHFGIQWCGLASIFVWVALWSILSFGILRALGLLRVSADAEEEGLDFNNGEPAYPIDPALLAAVGRDDFDDLDDEEDEKGGNTEDDEVADFDDPAFI